MTSNIHFILYGYTHSTLLDRKI